MLQTMLEASSTAVPLFLKTDTQYSEVTDVSGLSGVRGEKTCLRHGFGLHLFLSGTVLSFMNVSVLCI